MPRARACRLRLNNNLLSSTVGLPAALGNVCSDLSQLAILDLSFNRIASLDASIGQLYNLSVLRLHANSFKSFEDICHILPLKHLHRLTLPPRRHTEHPTAERCRTANARAPALNHRIPHRRTGCRARRKREAAKDTTKSAKATATHVEQAAAGAWTGHRQHRAHAQREQKVRLLRCHIHGRRCEHRQGRGEARRQDHRARAEHDRLGAEDDGAAAAPGG